MSKQMQAKMKQAWNPKPVWPVCGNCRHFSSELVKLNGYYGAFEEEKKKHCTIGGFATGKAATCNQHQPKGTP
jgi:hypothetical protein